jgi:hypothetical protein
MKGRGINANIADTYHPHPDPPPSRGREIRQDSLSERSFHFISASVIGQSLNAQGRFLEAWDKFAIQTTRRV